MRLLPTAAGVMFAAVTLGAFGAHGLRSTLEASGHQDTWETAVLYQLVHGLALFAVGIWQAVSAEFRHRSVLRAAAWLWLFGIILFSGSLYWLSLSGPKWLGPVTPIGGLCFLAGWLALAIGGWRAGHAEPFHSA